MNRWQQQPIVIKASTIIFVGIVVLLAAAGIFGSSGNTPTAATPAPEPREQFELIVSQSSCQESPSEASVNCSIGVKNRGDSAGVPNVYASYFYNDGGSSADESNFSDCGGRSDAIPAGELGYVYFCHTYDASKHDVIRAAVSLKIDAKSSPYVRVVAPGANWP